MIIILLDHFSEFVIAQMPGIVCVELGKGIIIVLVVLVVFVVLLVVDSSSSISGTQY